jgi:hypothetical protein
MAFLTRGALALALSTLSAGACAAATPPAGAVAPQGLSEQAAALIAPVHAAYARIETAQARLPAPKDDREKLERLIALDEAEAAVALAIPDLDSLPPEQARLARQAVGAELAAHDAANRAALKAMTPAGGWFTKSRYGDEAVKGAFAMVVSAYDVGWWKDVAARIEPLVGAGEAPAQYYADLYDGVALREGRPQRFGAWTRCTGHGYVLQDPVEEPQRLDDRRRQIGLPPERDFLKSIPGCAAQARRDPDAGSKDGVKVGVKKAPDARGSVGG